FKELVFGTSTVSKSQMQQTIKSKILDNFFLQMWANENNLNFTTHEHILDACIKAFVNYLG
ncbi:MAG: hypothetical protein IJA69_01905, partial [Clostridia bacterium]|nr:hypothetical protein [Clostridia bacterium]